MHLIDTVRHVIGIYLSDNVRTPQTYKNLELLFVAIAIVYLADKVESGLESLANTIYERFKR